MRFHRTRQRDERMAAHDAVGVEDDHGFVVGAPAPYEVEDVARLALAAVAAAAVKDSFGSEALAESLPQSLFVGRDALIARVGEDEEIERVRLALARERRPRRGESCPDAYRILVVDGHHDRGAGLQRAPLQLVHVEPLGVTA